MPSLKSRLRSETPEGYAAQAELPQSTPPVPPEPGRVLGANPYIRTPLPPFNAGSDTLRQFDQNGKTPTRRVIPLPASAISGGSTTINNNTTVTNNSSSSSSSGGGTFTAKTATLNLPTLLPGDVVIATLTVAKAAILMILGSSDLCEVRIYGDTVTQSADSVRVSDSAPPFEVTAGLTSDVILDSLPLQWNWQNRIFINQDTPQTTNMYISVLNPTSSAVTPSVTITYLPVE